MQRLCCLYIAIRCLILVILCNEAGIRGASACTDDFACADLGNIGNPFGTDKECAISESFVVSKCSSQHASWDGFQDAVNSSSSDGDGDLSAPELLGIRKVGYSTYINLTWTPDEASKDQCSAPFLNTTVSKMLPDVIDLDAFADKLLKFTPLSYFLLFGCDETRVLADGTTSATLNSSVCDVYRSQCKIDLSCVQLKPVYNLSLASTMENFSCSSFTFLAAGNSSDHPSLWHSAAIQLVYVPPECKVCVDGGGQCPGTCRCAGTNVCETGCDHFGCNKAGVIGVVVSAVLSAIIACMAVVFLVYHRRRAYHTKSISTRSSNTFFTQRAFLLSKKFGPVNAREFPFELLSKVTNSFSDDHMIGDGGFGAVYFGVLKDGRKVAIKRLYHDNFKRMDHFYNEIQILSTCNHPNLVKLYGFCCQDSSDLLLVFEYAANGTVSDHIHNNQKPPLPWKTRLSIMRETAEALSYLHNSVKPPIYHRDVKTTNILLDENLHVKLGDFGLSRLVPLECTHVSTAPQGTPGYLDPDYHQCYQLTDKSDVYSFGVVLVELVSAKLAVDMSRDRKEINLSNLALMKIGCGMWQDLVDPHLEMAKNPEVEMMVKRILELSFMCLHAEKDSRPTMAYLAESFSNLCQEFGYSDERMNGGSFQVCASPNSSVDETKHLMRDQAATKSRHNTTVTPNSSDWSSSYNSWSSGP